MENLIKLIGEKLKKFPIIKHFNNDNKIETHAGGFTFTLNLLCLKKK